MNCPFCGDVSERVVLGNDLALSIPDAYPVTPGHHLVFPRRHVPTIFEATPEEQGAVWALIVAIKRRVDAESQPAGYNLGHNAGDAAGQTIGHAHVHVIPRFTGDVDDPRGGVRWVIPRRAAYWDV